MILLPFLSAAQFHCATEQILGPASGRSAYYTLTARAAAVLWETRRCYGYRVRPELCSVKMGFSNSSVDQNSKGIALGSSLLRSCCFHCAKYFQYLPPPRKIPLEPVSGTHACPATFHFCPEGSLLCSLPRHFGLVPNIDFKRFLGRWGEVSGAVRPLSKPAATCKVLLGP